MKKENIPNYIILVCGVIYVGVMIFRYFNGMNVPFVGVFVIAGLFLIVWGQRSKSKNSNSD
ncbi:hypothetical protein OAI42_00725 [bacterium]|jgi:hypothetical protein|nr:hypothetical protein [bacterium]|tara:strand:- start:346 stop:528 length:183 start_codon:yes stop_codon:yes gene_type:complete